MAAPTNQDITTAIDLGSTLPISYVQQQDDAGTTYPCWWKFTVPAGLNEISARAYGNFGSWIPAVTVWRGPTGAPSLATGGGGRDVWNQVSCTPGEVLYIKSIKPAGNVVPAITTVEVVAGAILAIVNGDLVHPDSSTPDYSAVVLNSSDTVKKFLPELGWTGNTGVIRTPTFFVAVMDFDASAVKIYDSAFNLVATPALPAGEWLIGTNGVTGWWAVKIVGGATHATAYFIDPTGAVTRGPYDLGASTAAIKGVGVNQADTILYWVKTSQAGQPGLPVKQIVLDTLTVTDFLAGTADDTSSWWPFILVLADDSVIVPFVTNDATVNRRFTSSVVRHYSDAAVLLQSWDLFPEIAAPAWIFAAPDNPTSFWVWGVGISTADSPSAKPWNKYWHIVVDAALPTPIQTYQFIEGVSQEPGTADAEPFGTDWGSSPFIAFGPSASQTMTVRCERVFLLPTSPSYKRMFLGRIEFLIQQGVGLGSVDLTTQGVDPQVMVSISRDGGHSFGPEFLLSVGKVGEYLHRAYRNAPNGYYRNGAIKIATSDPNFVAWLSADAQITEGNS